jgi:hypothetical protein
VSDKVTEELSTFYASLSAEYDPSKGLVRILKQRIDKITEAYVAVPRPAGNLDIFGAQAVYLTQPRTNEIPPDFGRTPLMCLCSDARCRELTPQPKIIPIAYRKVPAEGEYKLEPHWRWSYDDWHVSSCLWVVRELASRSEQIVVREPGEALEVELEEQGARHAPGPRRTDHVDEFVPPIEDPAPLKNEAVPSYSTEADHGTVREVLRRKRATIREEHRHPSRTRVLREVVSSYERLKFDGLDDVEVLTIRGQVLSFRDWFRHVERHARSFGNPIRIWHGGAKVALFRGGAYRCDFFDATSVDGVRSHPSLSLQVGLLEKHPRGAFLREALDQCLQQRSYVRVYWYGRLIRIGDRIAPDIGDNLDLVHVAPTAQR